MDEVTCTLWTNNSSDTSATYTHQKLKAPNQRSRFFYENSDDAEEGEIEERTNKEEGQYHHKGSKQLRFEVGKESTGKLQSHLSDGSATSGEGNVRPWEFRKVIQAEYRERLPRNYELKHWKKAF
ncbi:BEM_collapsed_G0022740.mRNA.1.CDS.1 [Saccharomyces cerevisiae]|nr:BEM_collapsed_G0022740.mRNA.1.CDS.1 [Saccharomyces cerevisiae]